MLHLLVLLISLLANNAYGVVAISLDETLLTQLGFNNGSLNIAINGYNITEIDVNAFKGYTQMTQLKIEYSGFSTLDLELFKDSVNLQTLTLSYNPSLTQLTNSKKLIFPTMTILNLYVPLLSSLDPNLINGLPNLNTFYFQMQPQSHQLSPLKPNQLSAWKKLEKLGILTNNQTSLTKEHFNGLSSLVFLQFTNSKIKTIEVHTLLALPNVTSVDFSFNALTSFEYLQIPEKLTDLELRRNKMNYFMLSRTMGFLRRLSINYNLFRSFKSMDFTFLSNLTILDLGNNPHAYPNEIAGHMIPLVNLIEIGLSNLSINSIDSNFFKHNTKLQYIYLSDNKISVLPYNTFSNLKDLATLDLSNNQISLLDNRTFVGLNNLSRLVLALNILNKISARTFYNLSALNSLDLSNNLISEIDSSAFIGCSNLRLIVLGNNRLETISPRTFENLTLSFLTLNNNMITQIDNSTFDGVLSLGLLDLSANMISTIGPGTFNSVKITQTLYLSDNQLTKIENGTFADQNQLLYIDLSRNKINTIEEGAFNGLANLQYVHLENNNITELDSSTFTGCNNLQGIYLYNNPNLLTNNLQSLCPTTAVSCNVFY